MDLVDPPVLCISGSNGQGKTSVAITVAESVLSKYRRQFFIQGSSIETLRYELCRLARSLPGQDFFGANAGWLIIVDDVTPASCKEILDFFEPLLKRSKQVGLSNTVVSRRATALSGALILTSQSSIVDSRITYEENLSAIDIKSAVELLRSISFKKQSVSNSLIPKDASKMDDVVRRFFEDYLGNHPLSLVQFGRLLCRMSDSDAKEYMDNALRGRRQRLEELPLDSRHVRGIMGSVMVHLDRMRKEQSLGEERIARAQALLCAMAVLPANEISPALFTDHSSFFDDWRVKNGSALPFADSIFNPSGFTDAANILLEYNFIRENVTSSAGSNYCMESIVQKCVFQLLKKEPVGGSLESLGRLFGKLFVQGSLDRNRRFHLGKYFKVAESLSRYNKIPHHSPFSIQQAAARVAVLFDETRNKMLVEIPKQVTSTDSTQRLLQYAQALSLYAQYGAPDEATLLFEKIAQDGLEPNNFCFNALIDSYAKAFSIDESDLIKTDAIYAKMEALKLAPDEITMSALINAHAQAGDTAGAVLYYEKMEALKLAPNEITMSALINAHAQAGDKAGAVLYYEKMEALKMAPNEITMSTLLKCVVKYNQNVESMIEDIAFCLNEMSRLRLNLNKFTYGQLLLACKKFGMTDRAYHWFDELLHAEIEPTKMLCDVFFANYWD